MFYRRMFFLQLYDPHLNSFFLHYTSHRIKMCKRGFSQSRKAAKDNELIISKL